MDPIWHDAAARERFADDRRGLLEQLGGNRARDGSRRPYRGIRDIIRLLGFEVQRATLPAEHLAMVDFQQRVVVLEQDPEPKVKPGTDVPGLLNSSLAHELGHVRLHEAELAAEGVHVTFASAGSRGYSRREAEADCYAAVFLVPRHTLLGHPAMQPILHAQRIGQDMEQGAMWRLIGATARDFSVTPTLLKNQLVALGFCTYDRAGREVHVALKTGRIRAVGARG